MKKPSTTGFLTLCTVARFYCVFWANCNFWTNNSSKWWLVHVTNYYHCYIYRQNPHPSGRASTPGVIKQRFLTRLHWAELLHWRQSGLIGRSPLTDVNEFLSSRAFTHRRQPALFGPRRYRQHLGAVPASQTRGSCNAQITSIIRIQNVVIERIWITFKEIL